MYRRIIETRSNRLPKAELHVHLRNTLSTQLTETLAYKHGIHIDEYRIDGDEFVWDDILDLFRVHDETRPILRTAEDYALAAENYLVWCATKGMIYGELSCSYSPHETGNISFADQMHGLAEGIDRARDKTGIEARILVNGIRQRGPDTVEDMLRRALKSKHPYWTGYMLSGNEMAFPPEHFHKVFQLAHDHGLGCTIHAGEWLGPDSIRIAMNLPGVTRLGHGVRAIEDMGLVQEIAERNICLEICPSVNIRLGCFPSLAQHPFDTFRKAGVKLTINTDNPPYFHTSISREYRRVAETFSYTADDMLTFTINALNAAFIDSTLKQKLLTKVAAFTA